MFIVERSAEMMQQAVRWSTWRVKNQAALVSSFKPGMFIVQRSSETMQQSVLWSTWCEKNQATLHLTPPVPMRSIAFAPNDKRTTSAVAKPFLAACRDEIMISSQLAVRKPKLVFLDR